MQRCEHFAPLAAGRVLECDAAELALALQMPAADAPDAVTIEELRKRFPDE